MTQRINPGITGTARPRTSSRRWRRFCRRIVLPLLVAALAGALILTGFARLGGDAASSGHPYQWHGGAIFLTGGSHNGTYTTCDISPEDGEARRVSIPGGDSGLRQEPWFDGTAQVWCRRTVVITAGWYSTLYPYAVSKPVLFGLSAAASAAWWYGRRSRLT
jgi:hypothetical protein